jgi:peptidoglycan/xylan/chitin deacetylase (PgdA/CDA1 family)
LKTTIRPPSLRQKLRDGLQAAVSHARLCSPVRAGGGATVLMYHSIAEGPVKHFVDPAWHLEPRVFERHCAWLARHRKVVSLEDLGETLRRGETPEPGTVVITFDDGYLDNLRNAAPILARYELPATLFLPVDYIDRVAPQWVDRLYTAFQMRRNQHLEIAGRCYDLSQHAGELEAFGSLSALLIEASDFDGRNACLEEIEGRLGGAVMLPRLTLDWDDVRELTASFPAWEIGAHGAAHLDCAAHCEAAVREDVKRGLDVIESNTGRRPRHFSFPYGRSNAMARECVIDLGLECAVAASPERRVVGGSDLFSIGRIDARLPISHLDFYTAGGWEALPLRGERAA